MLHVRTILWGLSTLLWLSVGDMQLAQATTLSRSVVEVVDTNPAPHIFEAELSADEQDVLIGATTVHALLYKDVNNPAAYSGTVDGLPLPQIVVNVGDEIIVTLTNNLDTPCAAIACDTSLHWHGIELDNDSDGTGVTQNHVAPGESYTYRFVTRRPGIFWFHPHMKPGPQVFAGMYGAFIVKDPNESSLQSNLIIPFAENTHTVVLSDTEFDETGDVGYLANVFDPLICLSSDPCLRAVPWMMDMQSCASRIGNCQTISDAQTVLVNGQVPNPSVPLIVAKSGTGIRLRLINAATNRYFRLRVSGNGQDNNLYRVGGEGGLLEYVRLEGGILGAWQTKFNKGEIVLPGSARSDVVIVPTGNTGDVITITGDAYNRGGPSNNNPAGDLFYIEIDNSFANTVFSIAEGDDVLGAGGVENIKNAPLDYYMDPVPMLSESGSGLGSSNETILLDVITTGQHAIDGVQGHFEDSGADYTQVPYQNATRYARTGDLLELTVRQVTGQHHPFHHHGFSFQPVRILDDAGTSVLYEYDYNEFVDVIDVFNSQRVVFRLRVNDRPRITDNRQELDAPAANQFFATGGAAGRWVFHCHLFLHAALGMISELVVVDADRDGDGFDTSQDCDDFDPQVNPDADRDLVGFAAFQRCASESSWPRGRQGNCHCVFDVDGDRHIDLDDFVVWQQGLSGP